MASEPDGNDDRDEDEDFGGLVFSVMTVAEAEALVLSSFRMTWRGGVLIVEMELQHD